MNERRQLEKVRSPKHKEHHHSAASQKGAKANRLACDICRERKVRCDRNWPKCGRCARLGDVCGYKGKARCNEAQEDLPRQLKQLQDRLSQAEARFLTQHQQQQQPLPQHQHQQEPLPPLPAVAPFPPPLAPVSEATSLSTLELDHATTPMPWESIGFGELSRPRIRPPPDFGILPPALCNNVDLDILDDGAPKGLLSFADAEFDWLNSASDMGFGRDDAGSIISQGRAAPSCQPSPGKIVPSTSVKPRSPANSSVNSVSVRTPPRRLSLPDLTRLQNLYFDIVYPTIPILSKGYFFAHILQSQEASQVQALSYAVALMGSMVSPEEDSDLQEICLGHVRHYVDLCERDEDMPMLLSLDLFQALIFLTRFELTHRMIVRAWMTVGVAVRLANILKLHLHNPDTEGSRRVHGGLPPTTDPITIEMRRRSLWALYICETYASARAGMPPLLQEEQITIPLPCPGPLDAEFTPTTMPTLAESYTISDPTKSQFSSFSCIVLACALARRCQPHADLVLVDKNTSRNSNSNGATPTSGFWASHFSLLTLLEDRSKLFAPHLTVHAVKKDPVAFSLYVYLCGIDISLQEVALAQVEREGFSPAVAADSAQRSRSAAYRLAGTAWATAPRDRHAQDYFVLHGAFMARPVATAIQVLGRDLQQRPGVAAASTVVDAIHLLLGALDRLEDSTGFWHESVAAVTTAAREWDEAHGDRSADTWAAALFQQI